HCATVRSVRQDASASSAVLSQTIDAAAHRNQWLRLRAAVRIEGNAETLARLVLRVHANNGTVSYQNNLGDHPVTSNIWRTYEITGPVAGDAHDIEFGLQLSGQGQAWFDNVTLEYIDVSPEEQAIRTVIQTFADARNAHDGSAAAAMYAEDGQYL